MLEGYRQHPSLKRRGPLTKLPYLTSETVLKCQGLNTTQDLDSRDSEYRQKIWSKSSHLFLWGLVRDCQGENVILEHQPYYWGSTVPEFQHQGFTLLDCQNALKATVEWIIELELSVLFIFVYTFIFDISLQKFFIVLKVNMMQVQEERSGVAEFMVNYPLWSMNIFTQFHGNSWSSSQTGSK